MTIDELKNKIEKKLCPWHREHPTVEITAKGKLDIKACCNEFRKEIFRVIDDHL